MTLHFLKSLRGLKQKKKKAKSKWQNRKEKQTTKKGLSFSLLAVGDIKQVVQRILGKNRNGGLAVKKKNCFDENIDVKTKKQSSLGCTLTLFAAPPLHPRQSHLGGRLPFRFVVSPFARGQAAKTKRCEIERGGRGSLFL